MKKLIILIILITGSCIKNISNLNILNKDIDYDLINASRDGNIESVTNLLNQGANVNYIDNGGKIALMYASMYSHTEIVKLLIEKGANVNNKDYNDDTALIYASINGDTEIVKLLIEKGANVNYINNHGDTALIHASLRGDTEIVKLLIEKGANVNAKDRYKDRYNEDIYGNTSFTFIYDASGYEEYTYGNTSLIYASRYGYVEIVKLLIDNNADINYKDKDGCTALMDASTNGHIEIVKILIEKGADINHKYMEGKTALIEASINGHIEVVKLLVEKGAKVTCKSKENKTAIMYLIENMFSKGEDKDKYIDIVFSLIKAMENEYIKLFVPLNKSLNIEQENKEYLKRCIGVLHYFHEKRLELPKELVIKILGEISSKSDEEILSHPEKKRKTS